MFDSLTNSADGLFVLLYVIALVVFFLFGPHKVYESIFGALIGIGAYLLFHEMTFVTPEVTRTLFLGNWIMENRGSLLFVSKILTIALFFITPMTLWLNVAGVIRGTFWFFLKVLLLSAFFICFGVVLFSMLYGAPGVFGQVNIFPGNALDIPYLKNSFMYAWISNKSYTILILAFLLGFYKILFSHWVSRIVLFGGVVYLKGNQIFWKRELDVMPDVIGHSDDHGWHEESSHDDHHH